MDISDQAPTAARIVLRRLQQSVINPIVRLAWDLGLPIPGDALLETTGRRTGLPRPTPVCDGLEGATFWLIPQRGGATTDTPSSGSRIPFQPAQLRELWVWRR
jgi:hypothetical protein